VVGSALTQAARAAGLSVRLTRRALRFANIPNERFDELVESDEPPSMNALEELGKQHGTGRPPAFRKQVTLAVAFDLDERRAIERAARAARVSAATWVRDAALALLPRE
jgi:hypothetical protein